jgi:hypothetical protein
MPEVHGLQQRALVRFMPELEFYGGKSCNRFSAEV